MANIIEKKTKFYTLRLNLDLSFEVWKIRETKLTNVSLSDHELIGRKILDQHEQRTYTIQGVSKHWYGGWYLVLLLENEGSHGLRIYENISCFHPLILEQIEESKYRYQILD
jgi:hypothetical protein